ncbi:Phospholipase C/P1 nuclease, core [Ophiocordyceps sinensis CO18]|uniref:Phospholipase C/P1 nuclease, core n=1 Tax=Ophiocordyceps sinensis (strain Co18 / CGMCC 3.14243) TaxID=911162 RepID=T5AFQ5_OPHSC|nr:Phospholipase C/P1 nuclease, core [Ophiocordyceps sinensis CO18]
MGEAAGRCNHRRQVSRRKGLVGKGSGSRRPRQDGHDMVERNQRLCLLTWYVPRYPPQASGSPAHPGGLVFPDGVDAIEGKELGGEYFEMAGPVVERLVAIAGYRMAAWLDRIAAEYAMRRAGEQTSEEL